MKNFKTSVVGSVLTPLALTVAVGKSAGGDEGNQGQNEQPKALYVWAGDQCELR